ncbi:hypothetical protein CQA09_28795, partial [Klebsiella pneumoniae]
MLTDEQRLLLSLSNCVALCPNCHRALHYSQ